MQCFETSSSHLENTSFILSQSFGVLLLRVTLCIQTPSSTWCCALWGKGLCAHQNHNSVKTSFVACVCPLACVRVYINLSWLFVGLCCITWAQGKVLNEVLWRKSHVHISGGGQRCVDVKGMPQFSAVINLDRKEFPSFLFFWGDKITEQMSA